LARGTAAGSRQKGEKPVGSGGILPAWEYESFSFQKKSFQLKFSNEKKKVVF
jgi:hypothetical protein